MKAVNHSLQVLARRLLNFYRYALLERWQLRDLKKKLDAHRAASEVKVNKRKKVLFNTHYPWAYSWIDHLLAYRLSTQGHEVSLLLCDGLPYCEQATLTTVRPACGSCFARSRQQCQTFGLEYQTLGELLTDADRAQAHHVAWQQTVPELRALQVSGIALGEMAYRNLAHYFKGVVAIEGHVEQQYRKIVESAYLVAMATVRSPQLAASDVVVSTNGKFIQSGIGIDYAAVLKKDYVTWEVFNQFTGAIFAKNSNALEQRLDDVWEIEKNKPLSANQLQRIRQNFSDQAQSKNTPFQYVEADDEHNRQTIIKQYQLNTQQPIIVLLPNVEWDSTAMIDSGFNDMLDWLKAAIDYAQTHPEYQFIIRAHPGELKVPDSLKTTTPICERLRACYPDLPANVSLIEPLDGVSSYTLIELADVVMVYTSTIGLEAALRGIKPWVCAYSYYYAKGFSVDIADKNALYQRLDAKAFDNTLTPEQIAYAERLAYIARYRRLFPFPYFKNNRFDFKAYQQSLTAQQPVLDKLCQVIVEQRNCLDIATATW